MPNAAIGQGNLCALHTTLGALESWLCRKSKTFVKSPCSLRGTHVDNNGRQFRKTD